MLKHTTTLLLRRRRLLVPAASSCGRAFASASSSWTGDFLKATEKIHHDVPFEESANMLRELCQTDLLKATDIKDSPERFFEAHRILARHAVHHGPGFWVRFTVHYNLFGGTVLAVGTDEQVARLDDFQKGGLLGCFALTEKLAGVQSGLIVQTTIDWNEQKQKFILNTPNEGARKNWISQGFTADKAVVVADLTVGGENVGPHAFLMDFRKQGKLVPGISVDDMGIKTVGNDLDNAWIQFDNVELDKSAMLSKYAEINNDNQYELKHKGVRPFDMIGQRLYSGRICVAQAGLEYRRQLFQQTKDYSDGKPIFSFSGPRVLSNIPQLTAIYQENEKKMSVIDAFVKSCELSLSDCIRREVPPNTELVEAIATCKVRCNWGRCLLVYSSS
jgi:acyl-CoA oxidase